MSDLRLQFKPIQLLQHAQLCREFRADTHLCSYGTMAGFAEDAQTTQHLAARLAAKLAQEPQSCLHVWQGDSIVGQLNFGTFVDPAIGYISHFYVVPAWRGTGVAAQMEAYAEAHLRQRGYASARLSVAAGNVRAVRFYAKHGWRDLGPRADLPALHNMEKTYA